tara:strand:- start:339 stop:851 length:513 start_codon:yes stop_codon:yes gene_type:complete
MEWLGVLLLYLISGFMKKRQQNKNREMIESDPSWDNEEAFEKEDSSNNIEQLLNDLFEQNPKITQSSSAVKEVLVEENNNQLEEFLETKPEELLEEKIIDEDNLISLEDQTDNFEDNIYHSKLADRKELHFGNKWKDKINLKEELFNSRKSLRRSILIKEVLDKPLAMRD